MILFCIFLLLKSKIVVIPFNGIPVPFSAITNNNDKGFFFVYAGNVFWDLDEKRREIAVALNFFLTFFLKEKKGSHFP